MSFLAPVSSVFPAATTVRCRINARIRRSTVRRPSAAMMCLMAEGAERRRAWRTVRRRLCRGFVVLTMALALLSQQTGALAEVERRMYEPARISLRPGMFALAGESLRVTTASAMRSAGRFLGSWLPVRSMLARLGLNVLRAGGPQVMAPPGRPFPWQASDPAAPYSQVNLAIVDSDDSGRTSLDNMAVVTDVLAQTGLIESPPGVRAINGDARTTAGPAPATPRSPAREWA